MHSHSEENMPQAMKLCLNPCFNGRCTRTNGQPVKGKHAGGLNPCFNGRCTRTNTKKPKSKDMVV